MARAEAAHASARSDSIKGLAQSIAKPAYKRLLTAEPALRRAVPALIIAFLITIAVGAFVQVLDHRRTALADASKDIETIAEVLWQRLERPRRGDRANAWRRVQSELDQARTPRPSVSRSRECTRWYSRAVSSRSLKAFWMRRLSDDDVLRILRADIHKAGDQSKWARRHGVSRPHLNHV